MAKKRRKSFGDVNAASTLALTRLIEAQSKATVVQWTLDYVEQKILPLYTKDYPADGRPANAIRAARAWLAGEVKLPYVKHIILNECHAAARERDDNPVAQAAARAIGQAASSVHAVKHSLAVSFYAAAAFGYERLGLDASAAEYHAVAEAVCADYTAALSAAADKDSGTCCAESC